MVSQGVSNCKKGGSMVFLGGTVCFVVDNNIVISYNKVKEKREKNVFI